MKLVLPIICLLLFQSANAQPSSPTLATTAQIKFMHHLFDSIASPEDDPNIERRNESNLGILYGFDSKELATLHAAGLYFSSAMRYFQSAKRAITDGKSSLSAQDKAAVAALTAAFQSVIDLLANQVLSSVRPQTAALLRQQANLIATKTDIQGGR